MTATFDKLKELLDKQGKLSNEEVEKFSFADHGPLTDDEKMTLEAERHKKEREGHATVTLEEYLAATKVLDTADPSSEEYKKAEALVDKYESGM